MLLKLLKETIIPYHFLLKKRGSSKKSLDALATATSDSLSFNFLFIFSILFALNAILILIMF